MSTSAIRHRARLCGRVIHKSKLTRRKLERTFPTQSAELCKADSFGLRSLGLFGDPTRIGLNRTRPIFLEQDVGNDTRAAIS